MQGKCLKFHRDRGFGFIASTDDPTLPDIFVHFSDITPSPVWSRQFLLPGMTVEFVPVDSPTEAFPDRLRASNTRVIGAITIAVQRSLPKTGRRP